MDRRKEGKKKEWKEHEGKPGCGSFLTCPADRIARRWGEDLRGEVLEGHDLSVVLHDGLQVERPFLVAGSLFVKGQNRLEKKKAVRR